MIQDFLICKAHYIEQSEKRVKEKISLRSWHRHFIVCSHVIILDITWIIRLLHFVTLRFRAKLRGCVTRCGYSYYSRVRKPCINDRTVVKIMIIREELYSKDVMWSVLRYSTSSDHSHILNWRWIILIELIWWLQLLSKNSIIIKAHNLIIRLTA
jgi:hypothetical protein